jgi:uncharacterized membrane protein YbhN (UPF0104 family)
LSNTQDVRKKGHASLIARIVVATVAILWVFRGQDWGELAAVFRGLNPWYFGLSLVTFAAAQVIISVRWWLLLRAQSIHIEVLAAVRLFYLGLFYNNVMPGAVGGDLLKAWYVAKHTDRKLEGVLSVIVDRVIGLVGLVVMAVLTYWIFIRGRIVGRVEAEGGGSPGWLSQHRIVILWALAAVVAVLVLVLAHPYGRMRLGGAARQVLLRGATLLRGGKDALIVYCSKPGTIFWAFVLTFISQSIVIVSFWLVGRDLGIEAGLKYYFVIFPAMWVVAAVPVSIAGLGVLEAGIVELFTLLTGTVANGALALALCQRFIWVLASLPGGVIHLLGAHLPRDICVDSEPPGN